MPDNPEPALTILEESDRAWVVIWRIEKLGKTKDYYLNEHLDGSRDMYWALKASTLALACSWVEEHHQASLDNKESRVSTLTIKEISLRLAGRNCLMHGE